MNVRAPTDTLKRDRILGNATKIFLAYGYKRTTMDDIAEASGMSRPALYLVFRNKADIFRAIADRMFDDCLENIRRGLSGDGPLPVRLNAALEEYMISLILSIRESQHGEELLDLKNSLASDLVAGWHNAMTAVFREAIASDTKRRNVDLAARELTATALAEFLLDGINGMKWRNNDPKTQLKAARQLVRIVELAIAA